MAEENVKCFLDPKNGIDLDLPDINFELPHLQEITIGRGLTFGIKDLSCSKQQLILEANLITRTVKIRRIGRNPSLLAGFPMEENQEYIGREGMVIQLTPTIEFMISFETIKDGKRANEDPPTNVKTKKITPKFNWCLNPTGTVMYCETNDVTNGPICKVAAFDIDGTLISTKSGHTFPTNDDDWKLWHPKIKNILKKLVSEGYSLVMFTNQNQLDVSTVTRKESFKKKIENIIECLDVPFTVLIATSRDLYRKPAPGMWDYYVKKVDGKVDIASSFYVGDAAGRIAEKPKKSDFDITDRLFARNIGIKFLTPDEYFLNEPPRPFKDVTFHPHELPKDDYPEMNIPSSSPELIVMVGSPASGKSYFTTTELEPKGYTRISRDELKTWPKCRDVLTCSIGTKRNVVYDATNPDKESRKVVLDLCTKLKFDNVRCFIMSTSEDRCIHHNRFRQLAHNSDPVPHTAIISFNKRFEEPSVEEGFKSIVKIPFVPKFKNSQLERLYKMYLLGRKK